ncbi:MAG: hypothetical protein EBE86_019445 [Hormoscilla sp. GUM202]|nr:hypothetical protein [Hormoscilla sp. GUM202]
MEAIELKFMLKLLEFTGYRASTSKIKLNKSTKASERDSICKKLRDRQLVGCVEEVAKLKIAPPGKGLLELEPAELPVTAVELKALKACTKGIINPGDTGIKAAERQAVLQSLVERGFIEAVKTKITEVWLTERGQEFLLSEFESNSTATISLKMLTDYLRFMRQSVIKQETQMLPTEEVPAIAPSDEEILQLIRDLDQQLRTDNYLPIFHLREKLQPPLSREELDRALYRLEINNLIQLSALQEVIAYTKEQIDAGIPQNIGGRLFFIIVESKPGSPRRSAGSQYRTGK